MASYGEPLEKYIGLSSHTRMVPSPPMTGILWSSRYCRGPVPEKTQTTVPTSSGWAMPTSKVAP